MQKMIQFHGTYIGIRKIYVTQRWCEAECNVVGGDSRGRVASKVPEHAANLIKQYLLIFSLHGQIIEPLTPNSSHHRNHNVLQNIPIPKPLK